MKHKKPKKLPALWRRKKGGVEQGAFHVYIANKPINLHTDDRPLAHERRREAIRGARAWPRKMLPKIRAAVGAEGAAMEYVAALGETDAPPTFNPGGQQDPPAAAVPPFPPPPDMGPPEPVVEPEPIPPDAPGDWAADVNATPAADPSAAHADAAAPRLRLQDFAWFAPALVTASKAAVGLQLHAQAWVMRLVGDAEAGRVGPPPTAQKPAGGPENMMAFIAMAGTPWGETDPREPGRRAYESTIVALIPEELPVPAWLKWVEAPIVTAVNTVPVQWEGRRPIKRDADGNAIAEPAEEAPPDARAAA